MNIYFRRVKLSNFLSFGEAEVNLQDCKYTLVSGQNNNPDDMAKSNGSGKSSLWEAIVWCLTGDTIRGTKQVVNKYSTTGTFVELDFNIDNIYYKVIRYKDHKDFGTNLKIYVNNVDRSGKGIRDTEKLLSDYLPDITASLLGSVIILGQGLPQRFSNNTPAGRKEVLEKLSKSDFMIEDIKEKLSNRKTYLNTELRKYEDLLLASESKKSAYAEQHIKLKTDLSNMVAKDWQTEILDKCTLLGQLETNHYMQEERLENAQYNVQLFRDTLSNLETEYSTFQLNKANELHEKTEPLVQKKLQCNFEKQQLYKEIQEAKSIKDVCPTCGQKIPDVHIIDTTEMEAKYNHYNELIENYTCQIQELKAEYCKVDDEFIEKQKIKKEEAQKNLQKAKDDVSEINYLLSEITTKINNLNFAINALKLEESTFTEKQNSLQKSITDIENNIDTISKEIMYNINERDNVKVHLEVVNKMITIATRDFRGFLLSEIIKYIEAQAKLYSKEIFETDKIEFKLEGNNIYIGYNDKQYENLSGGEKQKVDLIVQFSIRDMLTKFLNFSSNILVLDEIFDQVDSIGCQKILNLISTKLTDLESIFIITHHSDIDIPADNEITIIKNANGISEIL